MSNPIDPRCVRNLNRILYRTGARIVLASAWRYHYYRSEMTVVGLDWLFRTHGVAAVPVPPGDREIPRIAGITRADTMEMTPVGLMPVEDERGRQIADSLAENRYRGRYVVIDDGGCGGTGRPGRTWGSWRRGIRSCGRMVGWG